MTSPFARNIKALRESLDLTQEQFAESLGVTRITIINWENGKISRPQQEMVRAIKDIYDVSEQDLFGYADGLYSKLHGMGDMKGAEPSESFAPVVGDIAAGDPSEAFEYSGERLWVPPEILERDPDVFYLKVSGDSMDQTEYADGTYAAISPNSEVRNGDIAAVKVNGDEATLKVYKEVDGVVFLEPRSHNHEYKRIIIDSTDPDAPYTRIIGKAVWPYYPIKF